MQLFSASWGVLRENKSLMVFPVTASIAGVAVAALFAVPILMAFAEFTTTTDAWGVEQTSVSMSPMGWVLAGIGYVVATYVGTFMNAALIVAANERLTGTGPGTVSSGFQGASAKAGAIFGWVLVSATVGLLLRLLEERLGLVGKLVIGLVGIAWSLLTFLVVPVLVLEHNSTGGTIARSTKLFKTTWGENVVGNIGFGIFGFLLAASAVGLFLVGVATGTTGGMLVMGAIALAWLFVGAQAITAMGGIYRVALYRYAVDGQAPRAFAMFDFDTAFRPKKSSGLFATARSRTVYRSPPGRPGGPRRDPWTKWEPPPPEQVPGEFGIEIPGAAALPGHEAPGAVPAGPPSGVGFAPPVTPAGVPPVGPGMPPTPLQGPPPGRRPGAGSAF